jgi:hypothetical protein
VTFSVNAASAEETDLGRTFEESMACMQGHVKDLNECCKLAQRSGSAVWNLLRIEAKHVAHAAWLASKEDELQLGDKLLEPDKKIVWEDWSRAQSELRQTIIDSAALLEGNPMAWGDPCRW